MQVGIVGLPVSGKTTLFSTLTGQDVSAFHEGRRIEVHRGMVKVPDERLDQLAEIFYPKQKIPTTIEYIEVGGMKKEQAKTQGFDPQFLQVLKTTDLLCVVIRAFENEFHPHPEGSIEPLRDIQTVETEFMLSDLSIVDNRVGRLEKEVMKAKDPQGIKELELMKRCFSWLESEKPLREMELSEDEKFRLRGYQFLSAKPIVVVINIDEKDLQQSDRIISRFSAYRERPNLAVIWLCAKVEQEISRLDGEDAKLFLEEMGIAEPALNKLIQTSYRLLNLISFFTIGENECQAWTIPKGSTAQKAAGVIHSDMEKGFIRAEVVNFKDFIEHKSFAKCREKGILRLEGRNYIVQDGDMITVRFNV